MSRRQKVKMYRVRPWLCPLALPAGFARWLCPLALPAGFARWLCPLALPVPGFVLWLLSLVRATLWSARASNVSDCRARRAQARDAWDPSHQAALSAIRPLTDRVAVAAPRVPSSRPPSGRRPLLRRPAGLPRVRKRCDEESSAVGPRSESARTPMPGAVRRPRSTWQPTVARRASDGGSESGAEARPRRSDRALRTMSS
jgi:hypothetical protein